MPGALPVLKLGPLSYQVSGLVTGGQLVVPTGSSGTAPPAQGSAQTVMACTTANGITVGSLAVLGVAGTDANVLNMPELPANVGSEYPSGYDQNLDMSYLLDYVAVYPLGEFNVLYEAACGFGAMLIAGVAGGVTPATTGNEARAIIGRCTNPGGVPASTVGLAFISTI